MSQPDEIIAFLALAAILFASVAGGYTRAQYGLAFDALLEARRQTFILQQPGDPLPPDEELMPATRASRIEDLISAFWWRPGDPAVH